MVKSQYSLSWDSYKSSVCNGFSTLQQNGEFVDMTLAADGHFVKVHKVLVALASPYLKDLISSAPCQHPVIFLNNVSNRTLCLLLEYIYTGEVLVRADNLAAFSEAARSLHIKGLENVQRATHLQSKHHLDGLMSKMHNNLQIYRELASAHSIAHVKAWKDAGKCTIEVPMNENNIVCTTPLGKSLFASSTEAVDRRIVPGAARKICIKQDPLPTIKSDLMSVVPKEDVHDYPDTMDDSSAPEDNEQFAHDPPCMESEAFKEKKGSSSNVQFTVSIRGSLQMILNRYIYNLNSKTSRTGVRRWRCVDYRNNKCTAFVVTRGNIVLKRANPHNHSFHDKKILAKMEKKSVFSALNEIEGYKDKEFGPSSTTEDSTMPMENDDFILDDFESEMEVKPKTLMVKNN